MRSQTSLLTNSNLQFIRKQNYERLVDSPNQTPPKRLQSEVHTIKEKQKQNKTKQNKNKKTKATEEI